MLKQTITFEDFEGETQTEVLLFNFSKMELVELNASDFPQRLRRIMESNNNLEILGVIKEFVNMAYGRKSEDGKRFVKSEAVLQEFKESAAYDELLFQLMSNAELAARFVSELLNEKLLKQIKEGGEQAAAQAEKLPELQKKYFGDREI